MTQARDVELEEHKLKLDASEAIQVELSIKLDMEAVSLKQAEVWFH